MLGTEQAEKEGQTSCEKFGQPTFEKGAVGADEVVGA